jgi:hypothetical protein
VVETRLAELASVGRVGDMSRVAISIQTLNGRDTGKKDVYLRKEVGTLNKTVILAAVEAMLDDQPAHTIGTKPKPTFKGHKPKADAEVIPGT